ncbi:YadA-like family protein [Candidatus Thioglobus sp.]|uniref:YadA-like family protein n=1 Tax=Candidatus Thioglobus sp. TaxID=2026721 RepID=UPI003D0D0E25
MIDKEFSFKLTKVAGVICSSMLIFGAMTTSAQAANGTVVDPNALLLLLNMAKTDIASNATAITSNATAITSNATAITSNATDITSNATDITSNATDITSNATDITSNATAITSNATDITSNATAITSNATDITSNATRIGSLGTNTADGTLNVNTANVGAGGLSVTGTTTLTDSLTQTGGDTSLTAVGGANLSVNGGGVTATSSDGLSVISANDGSASVLVTNGAGNTHGLTVGTTNTTLSGGVNSTTLTLDDSGATFGDALGAPVTVTGVADGTNPFDAVNVRQLDKVSKGVSMSMAMDGIPQAFGGQSVIGVGIGRFDGNNALAIGGSYHDDENGITYSIKAARSTGSNPTNAASAGVGWAF